VAGQQNALLNAIGGGAGLYRFAAANQIDLHAYAAGSAADTSLTDQQRHAAMMDELLAHMAEKKAVLRQRESPGDRRQHTWQAVLSAS
jgi:hypothetical protein